MEAQDFLKWKQCVVIDSIGLILFTVPSIDAIFTTLDQMRVQNGLTPEQILPVWTNFCSPSTAALLDAEQGVAWLWAQVASANPLYWGRVGSRTFCYSSPTALRSAFLTSSYISMVSPERYVSPTAQHANSMARFNPWAGTFYNANNRSNWSLNWCVTRKRTKVAHSDPFAGCLASCGPYFVHPKEDRQHPQSQTVATVVVEIVEHVGLKIDDLAPLLSLYVALVVLFCLGAFHRVYEKIMQDFDSTTSNFNGTFLVKSCHLKKCTDTPIWVVYLAPVRRDPNMLVSNIWTVQVLQVCPANKSKDLFPKLCGTAVLSGESASFSRPGPLNVFFLAQRPYLFQGTLREQAWLWTRGPQRDVGAFAE